MQTQRIVELDGLRGVAIGMVVTWHYFTDLVRGAEADAAMAAVRKLTAVCWSGVDLFFVLSGFLIGGIILRHHQSASFLKVFWIRRTCRILPALLILLVAVGIVRLTPVGANAWLFDGLHPWWSYLTFTQSFHMAETGTGGNALGITWSLAVEEQFYLAAPVIFALLGRRRFVAAIPPIIIVVALLRIAFPGPHTNLVSVFRADSLLAGFGLAALWENPGARDWLKRNRAWIASGLAAALLATMLFGDVNFGLRGNPKYSWYALLYAWLLLAVLLYRNSGATAVLRQRGLVFLGAISYGLYLYHQFVLGLTHELSRGAAPTLKSPTGIAATLLALGGSILVAWLSKRFVEARALRFGRSRDY